MELEHIFLIIAGVLMVPVILIEYRNLEKADKKNNIDGVANENNKKDW